MDSSRQVQSAPGTEALYCCPDCRATLVPTATSLTCVSCRARYPIDEGIPQLVGSLSEINESEVATQDQVSDFYEHVRYGLPWALRYHEHNLDHLLRVARPHGRVLDLGCGNGMFIDHLLRGGHPDLETVVGLDLSRGMLDFARGKLPSASATGTRVELVCGDSCRLPFPDDSFDVVYARGLLHHLPDPAAGAREIGRVLRPGGRAVTQDPHRTVVSLVPRWFARRTTHFDDGHRNFGGRELRRIVETGLDIEELLYMGYVAYPLLGFPDLIDFSRVLPLNRLVGLLVRIDSALSRVPLVRRLGWGLMTVATSRRPGRV